MILFTASNIIPVTFGGGHSTYAAVTQWDYGQILTFPDLELPETYQVHFSNSPACGTAVTVLGGPAGVSIPDTLLQQAKPISAYIFLHAGADDGKTVYTVTLFVKPRQRPTEEQPTPVQRSALDEAIAALQDGVQRVDDALDTVDETVNAALEDAKESGEFDGADGVSPAVQITAIEGGHRIIITDAEHPTGQSFDVMDGQGGGSGELYIVDYDQREPTIPNVNEIAAAFDAGKAVLASATDEEGGGHVLPLTEITRESGAVTALTFYAGGWHLSVGKIGNQWLPFLSEIEQPIADLVLTFNGWWNERTDAYYVSTDANLGHFGTALREGRHIDARLRVHPVKGDTDRFSERLLRQGTVCAVYVGEDTQRLDTVTVSFFGEAGEIWELFGTSGGWQLDEIPVGGGSGAVDSVNGQTGAVVLTASDVGAGTYSKPSGGIPKSDLAAAVQTSLGKADTALQSAPVTSVNGQTGAVTINVPSLTGYQTEAITDTGGYYTTDTVEGALQEIGAELAGINTLIGSGVIT